ncbi:MAG: DUF3488 domain-containing protein [Phycisphaerales bacterium]|nr:DUF3488 domain-containing protein [Phycisphaerales bacterium]
MSSGAPRARCLLGAAAIAVLAYATTSRDAASPLLALLVGALGVVLTSGRIGLVVPRWVAALATVAVLLRTGEQAIAEGLSVHDFAEFMTWMMVVKAFDRRHAGDDAQLLALSIFLCVASMLLSNGLAIATLSLLYVPLLAYAAMQLQLRLSHHRAIRAARRGLAEGASAPRVRVASSPASARRLALSSLVALCLGLLFAVLVFIVVPRGAGLKQIGQWGTPSVGRVVGFVDRVRVGMGGHPAGHAQGLLVSLYHVATDRGPVPRPDRLRLRPTHRHGHGGRWGREAAVCGPLLGLRADVFAAGFEGTSGMAEPGGRRGRGADPRR